jgi:hypothetical protein
MKWVKLTVLEARTVKEALEANADDTDKLMASVILSAGIKNAVEEEIPSETT